MPIYDYRCDECESVTEYNVPIDDRDGPAHFCEECGADLKRVVSFRGLTWAPTAGGMR